MKPKSGGMIADQAAASIICEGSPSARKDAGGPVRRGVPCGGGDLRFPARLATPPPGRGPLGLIFLGGVTPKERYHFALGDNLNSMRPRLLRCEPPRRRTVTIQRDAGLQCSNSWPLCTSRNRQAAVLVGCRGFQPGAAWMQGVLKAPARPCGVFSAPFKMPTIYCWPHCPGIRRYGRQRSCLLRPTAPAHGPAAMPGRRRAAQGWRRPHPNASAPCRFMAHPAGDGHCSQ